MVCLRMRVIWLKHVATKLYDEVNLTLIKLC